MERSWWRCSGTRCLPRPTPYRSPSADRGAVRHDRPGEIGTVEDGGSLRAAHTAEVVNKAHPAIATMQAGQQKTDRWICASWAASGTKVCRRGADAEMKRAERARPWVIRQTLYRHVSRPEVSWGSGVPLSGLRQLRNLLARATAPSAPRLPATRGSGGRFVR